MARFIRLTRDLQAQVDDLDYDTVKDFAWQAVTSNGGKTFYARRMDRLADGKKVSIALHDSIKPAPEGFIVRFKNGNTLDCTYDNLVHAPWKRFRLENVKRSELMLPSQARTENRKARVIEVLKGIDANLVPSDELIAAVIEAAKW